MLRREQLKIFVNIPRPAGQHVTVELGWKHRQVPTPFSYSASYTDVAPHPPG